MEMANQFEHLLDK